MVATRHLAATTFIGRLLLLLNCRDCLYRSGKAPPSPWHPWPLWELFPTDCYNASGIWPVPTTQLLSKTFSAGCARKNKNAYVERQTGSRFAVCSSNDGTIIWSLRLPAWNGFQHLRQKPTFG